MNSNQNLPRNSIDDIVTQCESLSISSSDTDNITLDSGIFCDNKRDIKTPNIRYKSNNSSIYNMLNSSTTQTQPPPPPPYNSNHNIISKNSQSKDHNFSTLNDSVSTLNNIPYHNSEVICCSSNRSVSSVNDSMTDLYVSNNNKTHGSNNNNNNQSERVLQRFSQKVITENNNNNNNSPTFFHHSRNTDCIIKKNVNQSPFITAENDLHDSQKVHQKNYNISDRMSSHNVAKNNNILGICNQCQYSVTDSESACIALGHLYHSSCFVCCYCSRSLRGKVFYKDQEQIFCEHDYMVYGFHKSAKICFSCGRIITETIIEALGKNFHPQCFKCRICEKCLDGIPFTVDQNNNIYCISDYHLTFAPRCAICCQSITPCNDTEDVVRVVVNDRDFHVECYRCQDCLRSLTNDSNCFVWTTDSLFATVKLLCRQCYGNNFRELSRLKHHQ